MKPVLLGAGVGIAVGVVYALSPLTVIFLGVLIPMWRWASAGTTDSERRWLRAIFCIAVALRLAAIAGLFLSADSDIPYANFFGDEEFFKRRTTWLRNLGMGIPISPADYFYTFDETGRTSYLYVLTYVQAIVGLAPYGVHLMNAGFYLASVMILYRLTRRWFGAMPALAGVAVLSFMPSLFIWSISALKEPLYFLVVSLNLAAAVALVRSDPVWRRLVAAAALCAGAYVLQSLREGGLALSVAGVLGGLMLAWLVARPRLFVASAVAALLIVAVALTRPAVQERAWLAVHEAASKHWGHINTPGLTYKVLDPRLYEARNLITTMTPGEAGRFVVRAIDSYITVPLPWQIESRAALAFLPEQMVWYCLLVLVVVGAVPALRRDPLLAALFISHGISVSLLVALSGGNVGTLVRHRGLAMPFFAWLAGVGLVTLGHYVFPRPAAAAPPVERSPDAKVVAWQS